jgi:Enoyl-(Acyl carrier protein) reductase
MAADSMAAPGCRPSGSAGGGPPAQGRDLRQSGLRVCDRHEITRFRPLLDQLGDLRYVVFTVDALHCQRNHGTSLAECGAHCPTRHHLTTLPGPGRDWACCREDLRRRRRLCLYHGAPPEKLDDAVNEIGDSVSGVQGDVANLADLDRLYEIVKAKGRIDIVFANAGLGEFAPLEGVTEEHFDKIFKHQREGALFAVQKALPILNDGGSIILTGSVASAKGTLRSRFTERARPPYGISYADGPSN